ncbi:hypothetical protein MPSEU_000839300 [Mayamaea pseudoterrestris]|nr:hypothetical protein MPSEU_000839300 [Mayamaea pseudoterrestris]
MQLLYCMLPASDLGCLIMTCTTLHHYLPKARVPHLKTRLNSKRLQMCPDESHVHRVLQQSFPTAARGDIQTTSKTNNMKDHRHDDQNDYLFYARYVEEAMGCSTLSVPNASASSSPISKSNRPDSILLPAYTQGRFASTSPEHSLCRASRASGCASWGVGMRGQLGHGQRQDERLPKLLRQFGLDEIRIVQVSAGGGLVRVAHSLLLTSTGRVLSFGTGQYGALGHGYSAAKQLPDALRPQFVDSLKHLTCVCVAAGELHSAVVTSDGDVYTWGDGFCGQLGHADKRPQPSPKQVTNGGLEDECVAMVTCGGRHTIAVTEEGDVFSWGLGHFGCLGRSYTPFDYDADAAIVAFTGEDAEQPHQGANDDAAAPQEMVEAPIVERDFAAELREHLELLANMTLDDSSTQCIPQPVDSLQGIKIVSASAGHRHSLFLAERGALYSCGAGTSGCLGHGDTASQMFPVKITSLDENGGTRVIQMSAGVDMSMAVDSCGQVYGWGKMDGGRIGLGLERKSVTIPRQVTINDANGESVKAIDVECGYVHSLIVGIDGSIHICGGVGIEGADDGQVEDKSMDDTIGKPRQVPDFNIWQCATEAAKKEAVKKERWSKYGKYTVKGRTKMMKGED